jgi:hypothetical protein
MGESFSIPVAKEDALFYIETMDFEQLAQETRKMAGK